jgi:hypothetical protein
MAVVLASAAFWAPVTYKLVGDDGEPTIVNFRARYKRLKTTERKELDRRLAAGRMDERGRERLKAQLQLSHLTADDREEIKAQLDSAPANDKDFLDAVLVDWELTDLTRNRIPYTLATREEVVEEWDGIEAALVTAYFDAGRKARQATEIAKNSEAPSATA